MRIGFSQRRTAAYLHVWAALLAGYAMLRPLRPAAPGRPRGTPATRCSSPRPALFVVATSIWMVYTLEILKAATCRFCA